LCLIANRHPSGFRLALNQRYSYILAGLVLVVFPVCLFVLWSREWIRRRMRSGNEGRSDSHPPAPPPGYDPEPWRNAPPPGYASAPYQPPPQQVGLSTLDGSGRKERSRARNEDLGPAAQPREIV
jgi:hypothetical protein